MSCVPPSGSIWSAADPTGHSQVLRSRYARSEQTLLLLCSRLSVEKQPGTALDALSELRARGLRAVLVVAGDGPLRGRLVERARAERLPVTFLGHVADRDELAGLQATADVCLSPGPVETFGLAALEALACGTPVVANAASALPEVVGAAGEQAAGDGPSFADAVESLLTRPERTRRVAARGHAEQFGWSAATAAFLAAHDADLSTAAPGAAA
jgi:alpha-1,6-mannosyltransferase